MRRIPRGCISDSTNQVGVRTSSAVSRGSLRRLYDSPCLRGALRTHSTLEVHSILCLEGHGLAKMAFHGEGGGGGELIWEFINDSVCGSRQANLHLFFLFFEVFALFATDFSFCATTSNKI